MRLAFTFLLAAVMGTAGATQDPRMYPLQICDGSHCDVYPVRPEIHSPMVEIGHCYRVTAVETLQEIPCPADSPDPFDVPPKESFVAEPYTPTVGIIHRTCKDKSRFLLMSEDNRWHCLALGAKP